MNIEEFSKIYFSKDIRDMVRVYFYYLSQFRDPRHNEICPICRKEYYKPPFRNKLKVEIPFGLKFQSLYSDSQMHMKPLLEEFKRVAKEEFNAELKDDFIFVKASCNFSRLEDNVETFKKAVFNLVLDKSTLKTLEGFGDKSAENLIEAIENSKTISFSKFVYGLGIRNVGEHISKLFELYFQSF